MSFERTFGSLDNMRKKTSVSLDAMLGTLVCVVQDVLEYNQMSDAKAMKADNQKELMKSNAALTQMILSAYYANEQGLSEFTTAFQEKVKSLKQKMEDVNRQVSDALAREKELSEGEALLQAQLEQYHEKKEKLSRLECDIKSMQEEISVLSDVNLDAIVQQKDELEKELTCRREREKALTGERAQVQGQVDEVKERIADAEKNLLLLKQSLESWQEKEAEKRETKERAEKQIADLKNQVEELQKWIENSDGIQKKLEDEYKELESKFAILSNAFNSLKSDEFIRETLYQIPGAAQHLAKANYPDLAVAEGKIETPGELWEWYDQLDGRIHSLLTIYEKTMKELVTQAGKITEEQK